MNFLRNETNLFRQTTTQNGLWLEAQSWEHGSSKLINLSMHIYQTVMNCVYALYIKSGLFLLVKCSGSTMLIYYYIFCSTQRVLTTKCEQRKYKTSEANKRIFRETKWIKQS